MYPQWCFRHSIQIVFSCPNLHIMKSSRKTFHSHHHSCCSSATAQATMRTVPHLRHWSATFSLLRPEFNPRLNQVGFMVDKVACFLWTLQFCRQVIISPVLCTDLSTAAVQYTHLRPQWQGTQHHCHCCQHSLTTGYSQMLLLKFPCMSAQRSQLVPYKPNRTFHKLTVVHQVLISCPLWHTLSLKPSQ